jgi:ABC-2 type transport system ATP-binding protein
LAALTFDVVRKSFGDLVAVKDLSFAVGEGEVFGFLGGNGAGKTTSLRMILDLLRPDSGRIEVLGRAPGLKNAGEIGFLPEERGLYRSLTALDTVVYFGALKGLRTSEARARGRQILERFGVDPSLRRTVDKLSKGMAQKVQLAAAIVSAPRLLLLDEPFSGLDPVNQGVLEEEILRLRAAGATVLFSTHVMQHAERLTDRVLLLAKGAKVFEGRQEEARALLGGTLDMVSRQDPSRLPGVLAATAEGPAEAGWTRYAVRLAPAATAEDLLERCTAEGFALRRLEGRRPSLHDAFLHLVGEGAP